MRLERILFFFRGLKAFSVDDGRTGFVIFLLGNPHLLEGGKCSQDGATLPGRVPITFIDDLKGERRERDEGCLTERDG